MAQLLEVEQLGKRFGGFVALDGEIVARDSMSLTLRVDINGRRYYAKRYAGLGKKPLRRWLATAAQLALGAGLFWMGADMAHAQAPATTAPMTMHPARPLFWN